jgi:ribonuclease E
MQRSPASFQQEDASGGGAGFSRFGEADEIDTTPREEPLSTSPNAASKPEWSFTGSVDTPAQHDHETVKEAAPPAMQPAEAMAQPPRSEPSAEEPQRPAKKGWWQRTFRSDG